MLASLVPILQLPYIHLLYTCSPQGGREVADFIKYLAKETKVELKGYSRDGKKKKGKKSEL